MIILKNNNILTGSLLSITNEIYSISNENGIFNITGSNILVYDLYEKKIKITSGVSKIHIKQTFENYSALCFGVYWPTTMYYYNDFLSLGIKLRFGINNFLSIKTGLYVPFYTKLFKNIINTSELEFQIPTPVWQPYLSIGYYCGFFRKYQDFNTNNQLFKITYKFYPYINPKISIGLLKFSTDKFHFDFFSTSFKFIIEFESFEINFDFIELGYKF